MASVLTFRISPGFAFDLGCKSRREAAVRCSDGGSSGVLPLDAPRVNGIDFAVDNEKLKSLSEGGNGLLSHKVKEKRGGRDAVPEKLEVLWDDGLGTVSVKDYLDNAKDMIKPDGGPPRWFCPLECGRPLEGSPTLLFLPGMDGVGLGLLLHHKALGKAFEVWCMHIPVYDRTPFPGLVKFVEDTLRLQHGSSPGKPIYLVGDSLGACLALAVAARNSDIDLVLILVNSATSFGRSQLQPLLPLLEALPNELHSTVPYLLSFILGDPLKMAMATIKSRFPPAQVLDQLSGNLVALLPRLSVLSEIIPKETLLWKLKLLKSAAAYANSRLHAVKAEVLVLASGRDNMVPSKDEAERLSRLLQNCIVRYFKDSSHTLLMEESFSLLTVIKGTCKYRRSSKHDFVKDFIPPSISEFEREYNKLRLLSIATSPVIFSTLQDGTIVKGLAGIPNEGPVLLVGYHMLMGLELLSIIEAFLREMNIMVRGMTHPQLFLPTLESPTTEFSTYDVVKLFGAIPVTPGNLFRLLSAKSYVLLYPGGAREALHFKGEEYKLFWPDQPEFVRMAARFGATIVPFGSVGEDDIAELVLDYNDLMKIPIVSDLIRRSNSDTVKLRDDENLFFPGLLPKVPGRIYSLFGKPIETKGKEKMLSDKQHANELYLQIQSEVERSLRYLKKKREEDPYRGIVERTIYQAFLAPLHEIPTFDP